MLLAFGIICAIATVGVATLLFLGNLGSETGETVVPWWPVLVCLAMTIGCFVLRHFVHGHALTW